MSSESTNNPSLVGGHAQYVKGAAEELVGKATGNTAWTDSAKTDKDQGVQTMKAASEQRDASQGFGKAEEVAGNIAGCEGMQREGQESKTS